MSIFAVVGHPDDEVLGLGCTLASNPGAKVIICTDAYEYAGRDCSQEKRVMAQRCASMLGYDVEFFGYYFKTMAAEANDIINRVYKKLVEYRPEAVYTHYLEGGHPDHDALWIITKEAVKRYQLTFGNAPSLYGFEMYSAKSLKPDISRAQEYSDSILARKSLVIGQYRKGVDGGFIGNTLDAYCKESGVAIPDVISAGDPKLPAEFSADYRNQDEIETVKYLYRKLM